MRFAIGIILEICTVLFLMAVMGTVVSFIVFVLFDVEAESIVSRDFMSGFLIGSGLISVAFTVTSMIMKRKP